MKKIFALLCTLLISHSAFAFIYSEDTSDPAYLQGKGYSQATIQAVDVSKSQSQGSSGNYQRYYKKATYLDEHPDDFKSFISNWYKKAKVYIDPIQDDGYFGEHDTHFTNSWFQELPEPKQQPETL